MIKLSSCIDTIRIYKASQVWAFNNLGHLKNFIWMGGKSKTQINKEAETRYLQTCILKFSLVAQFNHLCDGRGLHMLWPRSERFKAYV